MSRRLWKAIDSSYLHLKHGYGGTSDAVGNLQGVIRSMQELKPYAIKIESIAGIETDMPWSLLRAWFRFADVAWSDKWVTWYPDEQEWTQP